MRRDLIAMLACPRTHAPYDLDPVRETDGEVVEAFLVSRDERDVRPIFAGVAVLPVDLAGHLRAQGAVYRRSPVNDPRLARFLLGRAGSGYDVVPFEQVVAHYRDLAEDPPAGYATDAHPDDVALAALLAACLGAGPRRGRGLEIGCAVGRGVFHLCAHLEAVLGLDRSIACVRRARNIAVTREHFFLPAPKNGDRREIPLDLSRLVRDGADFAVADPDALPLADDAMEVVLVRAGDAQGAWMDPAAVLADARRVLRPGGLLVWTAALDDVVQQEPETREGVLRAVRCSG